MEQTSNWSIWSIEERVIDLQGESWSVAMASSIENTIPRWWNNITYHWNT